MQLRYLVICHELCTMVPYVLHLFSLNNTHTRFALMNQPCMKVSPSPHCIKRYVLYQQIKCPHVMWPGHEPTENYHPALLLHIYCMIQFQRSPRPHFQKQQAGACFFSTQALIKPLCTMWPAPSVRQAGDESGTPSSSRDRQSEFIWWPQRDSK